MNITHCALVLQFWRRELGRELAREFVHKVGLVPLPDAAKDAKIRVSVSASSKYPINKVQYFVNNLFVGTATKTPWLFTLSLGELDSLGVENELKAVAYDIVENRGDTSVRFGVGE